MAFEINVTEADQVFLGEDKNLVFTIYPPGTSVRDIEAGLAVGQDVSLWNFEWVLRVTAGAAAAVVTKTTGGGITSTTPTSGIVTVAIADTDTESLAPRTYHHALRRTDAGNEAILSYGTFALRQAAGH